METMTYMDDRTSDILANVNTNGAIADSTYDLIDQDGS
jgi:hypothetical protein